MRAALRPPPYTPSHPTIQHALACSSLPPPCSLYGRLSQPAAWLSLAASALTSLASSERICRHTLAAPGVEVPLASLHTFILLLHSGPTSHAFAHLLTSAANKPMQHCIAVSAWLIVAVGGLLPYLLLRRLERRGSSGRAAGEAGQQEWRRAQQAEEQPQGQQLLRLHTGVHGALPLYLASCVLWQLADLLPTLSPP